MNKTGLMAKISIKYVLRQVFGNILADLAVFRVFGGISWKYLNFAGPRLREISEALLKSLCMV